MAGTDAHRDQTSARTAVALTTAGLLAAAALLTGVNSSGTRAGVVEVLAVLIATALFAHTAYRGTLPRPLLASAGLLMMSLLTILAVLSVGWSLVPNDSLIDALRMIAYLAVLASAGLLAQMYQDRAREVLLGLGLAALLIALYALATRCFPGLFPDTDNFARLRLPFGYWNAVGCVCALGLVAALWAGTRRREAAWLEIASYPAGGLLVMGVMLSQSRGALLALLVGLAVWFIVVPQRLRSAGWLAVVAAISGIAVLWAYTRTGLTTDALPIDLRQSIGWKLFVVLVLLTLLLSGAGWLMRRQRFEAPLSAEERYRFGKALLVALALSPLMVVAAVGVGSDKGLATFSDGAKDFFTTSALAPGNSPTRLTQTNSLRGRYWNEAYKIFSHHALHGTGSDTFGAARGPFRSDLLFAAHAHGMVPQVAADLGILGLLVLLGLTAVWLTAAFRLAGARRIAPWRWLGPDDEVRLASVGLMVVALVFGAHSAIDWVWFLPGVAYFGVFAGGWVLGTPAAHNASPAVAGGDPAGGGRAQSIRAVAITIVGLAVAYAVYQPVRATHKVAAGLEVAENDPAKAVKLGEQAIELDPTSANAYMLVAAAQSNGGREQDAEATLLELTTLQPGNPAVWLRLAQYRLITLRDPDGAFKALRPALYLDPLGAQGNALSRAAREMKIQQALDKKAEQRRRKLERQLDQLEKLRRRGVFGND